MSVHIVKIQPTESVGPKIKIMSPNNKVDVSKYFSNLRKENSANCSPITSLLRITPESWEELTPTQQKYKIKIDKGLKHSYLKFLNIEYDEEYIKYAEAEYRYRKVVRPWLKKYREEN